MNLWTCPHCASRVDLMPGGSYFGRCSNCGRSLTRPHFLRSRDVRQDLNIYDEFGTSFGIPILLLSGPVTELLYRALDGRLFDPLAYYFSWLATKICPAYFEALAKYDFRYLKPQAALTIYFALALAIHRFYRPLFRMKYPRIVSRSAWFWLWPANLAVAVFFLFFIYAAPEFLFNFFDKAGNVSYRTVDLRLYFAFSSLMSAFLGHSLGVVAYAFRSHDLRLCRRS